eukprot:890704-Pelagomonas_calceolata.AAC.4
MSRPRMPDNGRNRKIKSIHIFCLPSVHVPNPEAESPYRRVARREGKGGRQPCCTTACGSLPALASDENDWRAWKAAGAWLAVQAALGESSDLVEASNMRLEFLVDFYL